MPTLQKWSYADQHIDPTIRPETFVSGQRVVIYTASTDTTGALQALQPIGLIQAYTFGEQRQVEIIFELGGDVPFLIPGRATGQLSLARILVSGADLANVLYHSAGGSGIIKSLREVNKPFNLVFAAFDANGSSQYSRVFVGCWITARQESVTSQGTLVAENCSIMYQNIANVTLATA